MIADQTNQTFEQFSDMLEAYRSRTFRRGEVVTGTIVYLEEDIAYVDIGAKRDALVPAWDLSSLEDNLLKSLKEGSQVQVYVTETPKKNGNLVVSIQRGLREQDWQHAAELMESEEAREYTVTSANRGGVLVAFGRMDGFVPNSQVLVIRQQPSSRRDEIKQSLIGSVLLLKVIDVDQPRQRLVLSEAAARQELRKNRLEELHVGQVITGTVVSLVPFGVFVDLGGIDGLVHISNLDWKPVPDPADVLAEGDQIEVLVTGIETERERISLSRKALLPNPWEEFALEHQIGELLEGVVESVREFGVFVRLDESIVGLIHVSELGDYGARDFKEVFKIAERILVRIVEIQVERERVGLSTRQVNAENDFDLQTGE